MKSTKESNSSVLHESQEGSIRVEELAPGVVRHTCYGIGNMSFYRPIIESCDSNLKRHGKVVVLIDSWDQDSINNDFRQALALYLKEKRDNNEDCIAIMLVRSKFVAMAMSVANMLAGRDYIRCFSDIGEWERECRKHVPVYNKRNPITRRRL